MKILESGVSFSSIVGIGLKIKEKEKETGEKYLPLNRGVNQVVNIDLSKIINKINFNSNELQHYAPNLGIERLRKDIAIEYFKSEDLYQNISVISGGMPCLDTTLQILDTEKVYFPHMYWGSYSKMADIRGKSYDFYKSLDNFNLKELDENSCIFICSPSNPTGVHTDKDYLIHMIKKITNTGAIIVLDCPYYRLFFQDNFFEEALNAGGENIIICESFSKCYGLSGIRLGFICSLNNEFKKELNIRMLYEFNGISTMPQLLVSNLISSVEGKEAIKDFQLETTKHIKMNIFYLQENNLLADEIYHGNIPVGIFAIINKTESYLIENKIGAVGMDKFVASDKEYYKKFSRICVSVQHELFKEFMSKILDKAEIYE